MSSRTLGPFPNLNKLSDLDINTADPLDILERADLINAVLAEAGCNCNGHNLGNQRDEYWGADLSELVARCSPHMITWTNESGERTTKRVRIRLETLQVEVDANNEIMAWLYGES